MTLKEEYKINLYHYKHSSVASILLRKENYVVEPLTPVTWLWLNKWDKIARRILIRGNMFQLINT